MNGGDTINMLVVEHVYWQRLVIQLLRWICMEMENLLIIQKKLPGRAALATPWVRHILRMEHERIHPDLGVRYSNAELPYSGIPNVPALVLQSKDDESLGHHHFLLIKEHISHISEIHLLDMPHTSEVDTDERKEIVAEWMAKQTSRRL